MIVAQHSDQISVSIPECAFVCRMLVKRVGESYTAQSRRFPDLQTNAVDEATAIREVAELFASRLHEADDHAVECEQSLIDGVEKEIVVDLTPSVDLTEDFLSDAVQNLRPATEWITNDEVKPF